jgi:hypothetical protein
MRCWMLDDVEKRVRVSGTDPRWMERSSFPGLLCLLCHTGQAVTIDPGLWVVACGFLVAGTHAPTREPQVVIRAFLPRTPLL